MTSPCIVAFGPFTFDSTTGALARDGRRIALQTQPARVLGVLVAHAGEIVTREQLRHAIWGDAWVDFDQGLNYCIRQIRIATEDDARRPRYVQTLPQRGYRFIAATSSTAVAPASSSAACPPAETPQTRRRLPLALAAAVILLWLGTIAGLHTARMVASEMPGRDAAALGKHLAPLHVARGAWTHHLAPLIFPLER